MKFVDHVSDNPEKHIWFDLILNEMFVLYPISFTKEDGQEI